MRLLRPLRRLLIVSLLLLSVLYWASRTEAPSLPGSVSKETRQLMLAGRSVAVTFYLPADRPTAPLVIVAHGFTRSKRYMAGWVSNWPLRASLPPFPHSPRWQITISMLAHSQNSSRNSALMPCRSKFAATAKSRS